MELTRIKFAKDNNLRKFELKSAKLLQKWDLVCEDKLLQNISSFVFFSGTGVGVFIGTDIPDIRSIRPGVLTGYPALPDIIFKKRNIIEMNDFFPFF